MDREDSLRALLWSAELGGFARAGRALGRAPATVAASVLALERQSGARLLDRAAGLRPTAAGRRWLARARAELARADLPAEPLPPLPGTAAEEAALRVAVPADLAELLAPVAAAVLGDGRPGRLDWIAEDRPLDPARDGVDLALALLPAEAALPAGRRLATIRLHVVAAPGRIGRDGLPGAPEALEGRAGLLRAGEDEALGWPWRQGGRAGRVRLDPRLRATSAAALLEAAAAGAGYARLPSFACGPALAQGRVARLLPGADWGALALVARARRQAPPAALRRLLARLVALLGPDPLRDPWALPG